MKTVNDLILELQALKPSLRELPVVVNTPNGMQFEAAPLIGLKSPYDDWENVENIVIGYR